jgi:hypothetical protein
MSDKAKVDRIILAIALIVFIGLILGAVTG